MATAAREEVAQPTEAGRAKAPDALGNAPRDRTAPGELETTVIEDDGRRGRNRSLCDLWQLLTRLLDRIDRGALSELDVPAEWQDTAPMTRPAGDDTERRQ